MRVFEILLAIGAVALYFYYFWRERTTSRAARERGGHRPWMRRGIRALLPLAALLIVAQSVGAFRAPLPLPAESATPLSAVGHLVFWMSALVLVWARNTIGRHWAHAADYQIVPGQALVTGGPYRYVRHPIYGALLGMFFGSQLALTSWFAVITLPLFFLLRWQAGREEILLRNAFGDSYAAYARSTGRLFPVLHKTRGTERRSAA